jgi:hypothetical protein
MKKILITILIILARTYPAIATTITYIWTDADPYYDEVFLENDASLDFLSGSFGKLSTLNNSWANLDGGTMTNLWATGNSSVNYYDGALDWIDAGDNSKVYLYAYDISYDPTGGINGDGFVQGYFYKDDSEFSFSCWNQGTYSHIEIVPEPSTFLFITFGALALRKRK